MEKSIQASTDILHIASDVNIAQQVEWALSKDAFLVWEDALYEGPINAEVSLKQLSSQRVSYFVETGWADADEITTRYEARNEGLFAYQQYREVVLWFDRDVNSQLQLIQLIDWFSKQNLDSTVLSLVSIDHLLTGSPYLGLNTFNTEKIQSLMGRRWEITWGQMSLCQQAWRALGAENPNALLRICDANTSMMPFMKNTILRFLRQFPSQANGLSHSEFLISSALLRQQKDVNDVYLAMQSKEGVPFMNQTIFSAYLKNMRGGETPMIEKLQIDAEELMANEDVAVEQRVLLKLTDLGRQILHNWVDWVQIRGINRWLGGAHLSEGNLWRYDQTRRKVIRTYV